ncbi:helix-turn-helix domain-containing protein [Lachnospiraceae bacterium 46-15]
MFDYMTVQETAKLWGISERQVQKLCKANRIEGVIHLTRVWLIPRNTERPADMRRKNYKGAEK